MMTKDRFNTVSLGNTLNGAEDSNVIGELSKAFRISKKKASILVNKKKQTVKKEVDWNTAEAFRRKLTQAGLAADVELVFTRKLFLDSLTDRSQIKTQEPLDSRHTYEIDLPKISPALFTLPGHTTIKSSGGVAAFRVNNRNPSISYAGCLLITLFALLVTQYHLYLVTNQTLSTNVALITNIFCFMVIVLALPSIISIRRVIQFTANGYGDQDDLVCVEKLIMNPMRREYDFYNENGKKVAFVSQSRFRVKHMSCHTPDGEMLFKLKTYGALQRANATASPNAKSPLSIEGLKIFLRNTSIKIKDKIDKDNIHDKIIDRDITPNMVVAGKNNRPIAFLYRKKKAYIEIANSSSDQQSLPCVLMFAVLGFNAGS